MSSTALTSLLGAARGVLTSPTTSGSVARAGTSAAQLGNILGSAISGGVLPGVQQAVSMFRRPTTHRRRRIRVGVNRRDMQGAGRVMRLVKKYGYKPKLKTR